MMNDYFSMKSIRKIPNYIINALLKDDELWSLLKYEKPIGKKVSKEERLKMICGNAINEDLFNVIPKRFTETALTSDEGRVFAQLRFQCLDGYPDSNQTGVSQFLFQSIVLNKMDLCDTEYAAYENRSLAIMQRVVDVLNGNPIGGEDGNYFFMNGGINKNSRFSSVNFNREYSGYQLMMSLNYAN